MNILSWLKNRLGGVENQVGSDAPTDDLGQFSNYKLKRQVPVSAPLCMAPWTSINFTLDGTATICCYNQKTSVSIVGKTIDEIWHSREFNALREQVKNENLEHDCGTCHQMLQSNNFFGVKAHSYDAYYDDDMEQVMKPRVMEFCLENTCNLACTMCNSYLSSTIRKNKGLPPLKRLYGKEFVEQLKPYIPHLKEAIFAGGEPFFIPVYYDIWESMIELNPDMVISVVTNGTVLSKKVKDILERGRFKINLSMEAVNKEIYESIRVNANLDEVLSNLDWFCQYGERVELPINIPVCPLTTNWEYMPEMVRFANKQNVSLNFVYVERPFALALSNAPSELLIQILERYESEHFENAGKFSKQNIEQFNGLINDLKGWLKSKEAENQDAMEGNLLDMWRDRVKAYDALPDEHSKEKIIAILEEVIKNIPQEQRMKFYNHSLNMSVGNLIKFIEEKSDTDEVVIRIRETMGSD